LSTVDFRQRRFKEILLLSFHAALLAFAIFKNFLLEK